MQTNLFPPKIFNVSRYNTDAYYKSETTRAGI